VLFGYARVSTADQNPDHQIDALRRAGVARQHIHLDRASGAKASRPELDNLLRLLREGDTLKVTRLDRLGRSVLHLVTLGAELHERGVGLHERRTGHRHEHRRRPRDVRNALRPRRTAARADRREHPRRSRSRARSQSQGRPKLDAEQVPLAQQLYDAGERTVQQIADIFGVPRTTVYGHLDAASKGKRPPARRSSESVTSSSV